jgi:hypothetical protein
VLAQTGVVEIAIGGIAGLQIIDSISRRHVVAKQRECSVSSIAPNPRPRPEGLAMMPTEREQLLLHKGRLETDLDSLRAQLVQLKERRAFHNPDMYERDKALLERRIRRTEQGLREINARLGER